MTQPHLSAPARLRGLLEVTRLVRDEDDLSQLLASIARAIAESLGFRTVVVNLYRPAWDDYLVTTVHGSEEASRTLLGQARARTTWQPLLDACFERGGAHVIPHGSFDWHAEGVTAFVPPGLPTNDPRAWHPEDALLVPLVGNEGGPLGILSVDEPISGLVPTDDELEVLAAAGAHAALALETAHERAAATRHRSALEQLLQVSTQLADAHSSADVLDTVAAAIRRALGFEKVAIYLLDGEDRFHAAASAGWDTGSTALHTPLAPTQLAALLDPEFEVEGCYLLDHDAVIARLPDWLPTYSSCRNGRGPGAWNQHWLNVPLHDRGGDVFGAIWVDDPTSRLLPSREILQVLRMFANQATTALHAASDYEALRDAGQARRAVIDASPLAILDLDEAGRVRSWNPAAERIFGWSEEEAVGLRNPIVPPESLAESESILQKALAGEPVEGYETVRRRRDGSSIDVSLSVAPLKGADGEITGITAIIQDITERKHARRAERTSEARKGAILQSALDCVILLDDSGRIVEFNPASEETFGWVWSQAIGMDLCELLVLEGADDGFAAYLEGDGRALVGARHELTGLRADGREFPLEFALIRVDGDDGPLFTAYIRDITKRRRSEDRLREMEAKYRTLVEGLPLVTYVNLLGEPISTTYISPQIEQLLGYPAGDWLEGGMFERVLHPDDRERVLAEALEARAKHRSFRSEYRLVAADGTIVSVLDETVIVSDEEGRPLFLQGYLLDLTERRRAEESVRRSEELYRLVVENSRDSITLIDRDGRFAYVSPSTSAILGYGLEQLTGADLVDLVHPDDLAALREQVGGALRGEPTQPTQARLRHADGRWVTVEGIASAVTMGSDGSRMILAVSRDVSDHVKLEDQLRQAQKMEAVGRLAGGVAHDFNNLLTAIGGFSDYLLKGLNKDDPLRSDASEIKKAADRAGELTQQLLAFSRRQVLQARILDPREVLDGVDGLLRRLIGEDVELVIEHDEEIAPVKADRGQLEQVIVNLALNARDAMPGGGRLTIACREADLKHGLGALRPGRYVTLCVSDTGIGIDEETRDHLFEPFYTTKGSGEGTGLGLATVHGIVEQSGGAIDVQSEPGKGTAFRIYLPRVDGRPELVEVTAVSPALERGSETVLLVEDEDAVRALALRILTAEGYLVLEARNGSEALELSDLHAGGIDLLVTDVVMPGLSGREVANALAARRPQTKVLYMSGYTQDAIVHHGVLDPDVALLDKPFNAATLAARVREVLDGDTGPAGARVLVVEDEDPLRELIRTGLEEIGLEVFVAKDPLEAIRIVQREQEPIELMLTDIFMPRMSGRTLALEISTLRPEMKLLYMSGKPEETLLDFGVVASGSHFLCKPFSVDELQRRVRSALAAPARKSA